MSTLEEGHHQEKEGPLTQSWLKGLGLQVALATSDFSLKDHQGDPNSTTHPSQLPVVSVTHLWYLFLSASLEECRMHTQHCGKRVPPRASVCKTLLRLSYCWLLSQRLPWWSKQHDLPRPPVTYLCLPVSFGEHRTVEHCQIFPNIICIGKDED